MEARKLLKALNWDRQNGKRLFQRRNDLGLTQKQVAQLAGVTQVAISNAEAGTYVPRDHIKVAIALALCVEVEDIWPYPTRVELTRLRDAIDASVAERAKIAGVA